MIKEVFGPGYELKVDDQARFWSTSFHEKGKESGPHVTINITCSWIFDDLLSITIDIYSKL
jgi:hypothetical protein